MEAANLGLALIAGVLSSLSPCVLPLLPLVLGAASAEHKLGPAALAAGLALSFTAVGLFVAVIGFAMGLDIDLFRKVGAVLLIGVGLVLVAPPLQERFATAAGPVSGWASARTANFAAQGLGGQFALGLLLGAVWSPCVGPTLGAASLLAAKGESLGEVAVTMALFGIGAALPLLLLGLLSREAALRWRKGMSSFGRTGKIALGSFLLLMGSLVLTGLDKSLETALVAASPDWLTRLTTRF